MEKDIGKIKKNDNTDIVVRIDDFGGRVGLTIREYINGDRYTGFTKSGTRIPAEAFQEFKSIINSIDESDLQQIEATEQAEQESGQAEKQEEQADEGQETL